MHDLANDDGNAFLVPVIEFRFGACLASRDALQPLGPIGFVARLNHIDTLLMIPYRARNQALARLILKLVLRLAHHDKRRPVIRMARRFAAIEQLELRLAQSRHVAQALGQFLIETLHQLTG